MRIASTQYHQTMNNALQEASSRTAEVMQQMASGLRVLHPSDEPITSVRLSRLNREEAALVQYRENIAALGTRLSQNEEYLGAMSDDLLAARDLLVWAADGSNASEDVQAMAGSLRSLRDSLYYSANTRDQEGRYLFSGTMTSTPAVGLDTNAAVGARYAFTGNTELQNVVVGKGVTQPANVVLPEMAALLNQLDLTIAALETPGADPNDPAVHGAVEAAMNQADVALGSFSAKIASLGGAQNVLQSIDGSHASVSLSNRQAMVLLGELDYGDAAVKLNGYTNALQATQKAYAKVVTLSLFDVI